MQHRLTTKTIQASATASSRHESVTSVESPQRLNPRALSQLVSPDSATHVSNIEACVRIYTAIISSGLAQSVTLELMYLIRLIVSSSPPTFKHSTADSEQSFLVLFQSMENIVLFGSTALNALFPMLPCLGRTFLTSLVDLERIQRFCPAFTAKLSDAVRILDTQLPQSLPSQVSIFASLSDDDVDVARVDVDDRTPFKEQAAVNHSIERARDGLAALFEEWTFKHSSPTYNFTAEIFNFFHTIDVGSISYFAVLFCQMLVDKACPSIGDDSDARHASMVRFQRDLMFYEFS